MGASHGDSIAWVGMLSVILMICISAVLIVRPDLVMTPFKDTTVHWAGQAEVVVGKDGQKSQVYVSASPFNNGSHFYEDVGDQLGQPSSRRASGNTNRLSVFAQDKTILQSDVLDYGWKPLTAQKEIGNLFKQHVAQHKPDMVILIG